MEKIKVIEKAKGMGKEGALAFLRFHHGLQETKIRRLRTQTEQTVEILEAIKQEIDQREKKETE